MSFSSLTVFGVVQFTQARLYSCFNSHPQQCKLIADTEASDTTHLYELALLEESKRF